MRRVKNRGWVKREEEITCLSQRRIKKKRLSFVGFIAFTVFLFQPKVKVIVHGGEDLRELTVLYSILYFV